ncbi:MAG: hypothetical protein CMH52_01135 [Myxococcales bacterium]|nr:hypothetical protein [Myxococcales bacterium]
MATHHGVLPVVFILACFTHGCGSETESTTVLSIDAGMVDTDSSSQLSPYQDYCQRVAEAKCNYIFQCVSNGIAIQSYFALPGRSAEACAEQAASDCLRDVDDRSSRGTLDFTESAIDSCVQQVSSRPCIDSDPSEWAHQWHDFIANFCGGVARGNVQTGDGCVVRSDCFNRHDVCISGQCRTAVATDLRQPCTATGTLGNVNESDVCPTGLCVNAGYGGTCTVDCRNGRGCVGDDVACLRLSVTGGGTNSFCVVPCMVGDTCGDLACREVDVTDPMSETYCLGASE